MKVTLLKPYRKTETINRLAIEQMAGIIRDCKLRESVRRLREVYHLMRVIRYDDGRVQTNFKDGVRLPRVCFSAELANKRGEQQLLRYNGLVTLELNGLETYDDAVRLRDQAKRLPHTLMAFLGASGKSVKIVCRGELFADSRTDGEALPADEADIRQFHLNLYREARLSYSAQLHTDIESLPQPLSRTVYLSADPEMGFNPGAEPFYVDTLPDSEAQKEAPVSRESSYLMPGRTIQRTYRMNWLFIVENVLGHYFELPDESRQETLLMEVAACCLNEGIPMGAAVQMTMEHPVLNTDRLLVEKTFSAVYSVALQADYRKKHKLQPLKSVPEDTLLMMKTEMFLNANYDMRKNVMTGVAQYRRKFSDDQEFYDLDQEVRNDMTISAKELGLKSWDKDIERFIESSRIEKFDPVNTWLDSLPDWDGRDRIAELAARVPTNQPQWEKYLRTWLLGMVHNWQDEKALTGNALVPLLIGRQGCGKTRFCGILLPEELRPYYNKEINFKNEASLNLGLTSNALINIDEFDKVTLRQQVVLKYLLSTADVKFRPPYGKAMKQFRRYASFIGTTNEMKPLTDPTGSRRFVCVEVTGDINFQDTIDHRQLFAQLKQMLREGARSYLQDEEINELIRENERFQRLSSLSEMISDAFQTPVSDADGRWWSLKEISELLVRRFRSYDPKTSFRRLGSELTNHPLKIRSRRISSGWQYFMKER